MVVIRVKTSLPFLLIIRSFPLWEKKNIPETIGASGMLNQSQKENKSNEPFFYPAFTVASGVTPDPEAEASRGVYRREGISPFPESLLRKYN